MDCWKFTPYDLDKWNKAEERILFVAHGPNGDNPNGKEDMGHWFKTAPQNNFYKNEPFYRRCEIILNGINGKNGFDNFRFMDLKATQGGGKANKKAVSDYVKNNLKIGRGDSRNPSQSITYAMDLAFPLPIVRH